jgi:hypothetical protein
MKVFGKLILSLVLVPLAVISLFRAYQGLMGVIQSGGASGVMGLGLAALGVQAVLFVISMKLFLMYVLDRRDESADFFLEE